jgi:hypothetical protein
MTRSNQESSLSEPDVVWQNTVDGGIWDCRVVRNSGGSTGTLYVAHVATGRVILEQVVHLSYGAIFGPDVADVSEWEGKSLAAIDSDQP